MSEEEGTTTTTTTTAMGRMTVEKETAVTAAARSRMKRMKKMRKRVRTKVTTAKTGRTRGWGVRRDERIRSLSDVGSAGSSRKLAPRVHAPVKSRGGS